MGKFTAIQTYSRFESLWEQNKIDNYSLNFIIETGQLYTHGIYINSAAYGTEANGAVQLTIAGTTKQLSLSNHTHANYLEKNANIDIGSYKIVSGQKDLLYYSAGNTYLGNATSPTVILGTGLTTVKNDASYTVLDTGNFSISNTIPSSGQTLSNVAIFQYASNTVQLDYVKRLNGTSSFDTLASYTSAGTTTVNSKDYGFITLYKDGDPFTSTWAQLRMNIPDQTVQFRTSKNSTTWITLSPVANALNTAGIVAAPTSNTKNQVWMTNSSGTPAWRTVTAPSTVPTLAWGAESSIGTVGGITFKVKLPSDPSASISATLSSVNLTSSWTDVDNLNTRLTSGNGSYIIQITYASCIYTGTFSYIQGGTVDDEIILHCSGTIDSVGGVERGRLYAKIGSTSSTSYLKLATSQNENNAIISIKYRKLI